MQTLSFDLNQDLDRVFKQGLSIEKLFAVHGKKYAFSIARNPAYRFETKIEFINDSQSSTLMRVETNDRVGLVHIINRALLDGFGINIQSLDLAAESYKAKDTFRLNYKGNALENSSLPAVSFFKLLFYFHQYPLFTVHPERS